MELLGVILSVVVLDEVVSLAIVDLRVLEAPGGLRGQVIEEGWVLLLIGNDVSLSFGDILGDAL